MEARSTEGLRGARGRHEAGSKVMVDRDRGGAGRGPGKAIREEERNEVCRLSMLVSKTPQGTSPNPPPSMGLPGQAGSGAGVAPGLWGCL